MSDGDAVKLETGSALSAPPTPKPASNPLKRKEPSDEPEPTPLSTSEPLATESATVLPEEYKNGHILCQVCKTHVNIRDRETGGFTVQMWEEHREQCFNNPSSTSAGARDSVIYTPESTAQALAHPPTKRRRAKRTEDERIDYLRADPYVAQFEAYRVLCASCDKWIRLRPNSTYCSIPWDAHRKSCLAKKINTKNAYALEERNNLFSKDTDIRKFDAERLLCNRCDQWLSVPADDHLQAVQKWLHHRASCNKSSPSSPTRSVPAKDVPRAPPLSETQLALAANSASTTAVERSTVSSPVSISSPKLPSLANGGSGGGQQQQHHHRHARHDVQHPGPSKYALHGPRSTSPSFHDLNPNNFAPIHESRRRNAEQRAATLRADHLIGEVEPNRVFCSLCKKWVQLRQDSSFCAYPWLQHRGKCLARQYVVLRRRRDSRSRAVVDSPFPLLSTTIVPPFATTSSFSSPLHFGSDSQRRAQKAAEIAQFKMGRQGGGGGSGSGAGGGQEGGENDEDDDELISEDESISSDDSDPDAVTIIDPPHPPPSSSNIEGAVADGTRRKRAAGGGVSSGGMIDGNVNRMGGHRGGSEYQHHHHSQHHMHSRMGTGASGQGMGSSSAHKSRSSAVPGHHYSYPSPYSIDQRAPTRRLEPWRSGREHAPSSSRPGTSGGGGYPPSGSGSSSARRAHQQQQRVWEAEDIDAEGEIDADGESYVEDEVPHPMHGSYPSMHRRASQQALQIARRPFPGGLADLDSPNGRKTFAANSIEHLFCSTYEHTDDMPISSLVSYLNAAMPLDKHEDFDTAEVVRYVAALKEKGRIVLQGDIIRVAD